MNQLPMFDAPAAVELPLPKITVRRRVKEGRALADLGMQRAIDKAGDLFKQSALRFFVTYAMNAGTPVGVAEARLASTGAVPAVKNARAWGQIPKLAEKEGYVRFAGHAASTDPRSHSCPRGTWQWTGKTLTSQHER